MPLEGPGRASCRKRGHASWAVILQLNEPEAHNDRQDEVSSHLKWRDSQVSKQPLDTYARLELRSCHVGYPEEAFAKELLLHGKSTECQRRNYRLEALDAV